MLSDALSDYVERSQAYMVLRKAVASSLRASFSVSMMLTDNIKFIDANNMSYSLPYQHFRGWDTFNGRR